MVRKSPVLLSSLLLIIATVTWLAGTGVELVDAVVIALALVTQTVTGGWVWAMVRRGSTSSISSVEFLAMGCAVGSSLAMASGVLLRPVMPAGFGWIAPSVILLAVWLFTRVRQRAGKPPKPALLEWPSWPVVSAVLLGMALGLIAATVNLAHYPLHWVGQWSQYHPDIIFFEGLSTGLARYGPGDSVFMTGAGLRYHWFVYAWSGQLTDSLGLEPFVVLTRVLPLLTVFGSAALAAVWAGRHTTNRWVPALAVSLITAGGFLGASYGTLLNFDSPSQAMATVWVLALSFAIIEYLDGSIGRQALWVIGLLGIACVGGKSSAAIVTIGAVGLAFIVGFLGRTNWWRQAWRVLLVLGVPGVVIYLLVLSGSDSLGGLHPLTWDFRASTVQGLNLGLTGWGIAAGTGFLILAVLPRWAGLAGFWLDRTRAISPASVVGIGLVVMAIAPIALMSHGVNELWFALSASAPLSVISAIGVGLAWQSLNVEGRSSRRICFTLALVITAIGLIVFAVVSLIWVQGAHITISYRALGPVLALLLAGVLSLITVWSFRGHLDPRHSANIVAVFIMAVVLASSLARLSPLFTPFRLQTSEPAAPANAGTTLVLDSAPVAPVLAIVAAPLLPVVNEWSAAEVKAAEFLRTQASPADIISTDQDLRALIPALTGLRTYMSGVEYQTLYGRPTDVAEIPYRVGVSERFASTPTAEDFATLCARGVTWLWVSRPIEPSTATWASFAVLEFANERVSLLRLIQDNCPAP